MQRLELEDLIVIAEILLDIPAPTLMRTMDVGMAESALAAPFAEFGGREFYEGYAVRAAILASRLMRNHPLIDGNKRLALIAMIEFLRCNGQPWPTRVDQDELAETFERVAARSFPRRASPRGSSPS